MTTLRIIHTESSCGLGGEELRFIVEPKDLLDRDTRVSWLMLGLAKRIKARILQASTSEVYGDPEVHPQTEAYWGRVNPIKPRLAGAHSV